MQLSSDLSASFNFGARLHVHPRSSMGAAAKVPAAKLEPPAASSILLSTPCGAQLSVGA